MSVTIEGIDHGLDDGEADARVALGEDVDAEGEEHAGPALSHSGKEGQGEEGEGGTGRAGAATRPRRRGSG